jgi:hypothetical protein
LSTNPQPLITGQQGGTPLETAQRLAKRDPNKSIDLEKWCQQHLTDFKRKDHLGYRQRHRRWMTNWLFYEGRQYGEWDELDGEFIDAIPTRRNNFYIDNHFSWLIDSSQKEWARSKTKLIARPLFESPETAGKARIGTDILAAEQNRLRDPVDHQGEGLTAAMCGIYARYTAYSVHSGNVKHKLPQYEQRDVQLSAGYDECQDCGAQSDSASTEPLPVSPTGLGQQQPSLQTDQGFPAQMGQMGSPTDFTQAPQPAAQTVDQNGDALAEGSQSCPHCGGNNVRNMPPVTTSVQKVSGYQEINAGEIVSWNVDPFELRIHPRARKGKIATSPYLVWERKLLICEVQAAFPWADAERIRDTSGRHDTGQRFPRELERSPGNVANGYGINRNMADDDDDGCLVAQVWEDRVYYDQEILKEDLQLDSGQVIKAGIPLGQQFPDGMCYVMAGSQMLCVWNENKNKHWVFGCYRVMPTSFFGRGVEDAVQDQKLLNDAYNLVVAKLRYESAGSSIGNAASGLDNNDFSGIPGEIAWLESWDPSIPIDNAFKQFNGKGISAGDIQFLEDRKKAIQAKIGSFSNISGAPDVDNKTATGIKIMRESAIALIAMALDIKGQVDAKWGEQVLELAQENWIFPHPVQITNEYGAIEMQWFSNCDISAELQVTYDEGSVTPRSEIERRNDLVDALNVAGIPLGPWNPSIPPEVKRLIADRFNIPFNSDLYQQEERKVKMLCDQLIASMQETAGQAQDAIQSTGISTQPTQPGMPTPAQQFMATLIPQVLASAPIEPLMDDPQVGQAYIKKWFKKDDGLLAEEPIRAIMRARYQEYEQAEVQQAQHQQMKMMASNGPMMAMQQQQAAAAGAGAHNAPPGKAKPPTRPGQPPSEPVGSQLEDPHA